MSLAKLSKKLRKRYKTGRVGLYGADQTAKDVVGRWKSERDAKVTTWSANYVTGVKEADTTIMSDNLKEWYAVLKETVAPKLRETVSPIYAEAKVTYAPKKKVPVKAKA